MKAAIYTRVSTPGQAGEEAVSLPEQERQARALCEREGWPVAEHYREAGKSATKDDLQNRPAMQKLLRDAEAGWFNRLVCFDQDRLARNMFAWAMIGARLKAAGVQVFTTKGGHVDFGDSTDLLVSMFHSWKAQEEAADIRERCANGRRGYARRGDFPVWQEPFGYKWIPGDLRKGKPNTLLPVAAELETVREVFALAVTKGQSIRALTKETNRRGQRTRTGKAWHPSDIAGMLADERYRGRWVVWAEGEGADRTEYLARPDLIPEQAVSEAVWRRAQKARLHHKAKTRRPMLHSFLLNGFLYCDTCGGAMTGHQIHDEPPVRYYVCSRKAGNAGKPCKGRYVPAEPLELEAMMLLEELAEHPDMARHYLEATRRDRLPGLREEAARIERAIKGARNEVDGLLRALARDEITGADLARLRPSLEADIAAWQERETEVGKELASAVTAEAAVEGLAGLFGGLGKRVAELDLRERRWLLAQLDFRMDLGCADWSAKSQERRYDVLTRWCGADLVASEPENVAIPVVAPSFALPM